MRFGYADDRAWWQAWPAPTAMTAFWGLPTSAVYCLVTGVTRRPGPRGPGIESTAATTPGASWAGASPTSRPAPARTGGPAMSFPGQRPPPCRRRPMPMTAVAADTVRS
jgi:hypothetical protein